MKKLRQIVEDIKALNGNDDDHLQSMLWKLICYSPKMPSRLHQQNLLDTAQVSTLKVYDQYFSKKELNFTCFKWGKGPIKILLTHGWGSKAIDFSELINVLLINPNLEVWAFDAPGNGSSEGELSNLILFVDAIRQIQNTFGMPSVMIGHSLGGMANVLAIHQARQYPELLISIAPLINLTENFRTSMTAVNISEQAQKTFFNTFEKLYAINTDSFLLNRIYSLSNKTRHLLIYEANDQISPASFVETFLKEYPEICISKYEDTSHARIIIDPRVIAEINKFISLYLI